MNIGNSKPGFNYATRRNQKTSIAVRAGRLLYATFWCAMGILAGVVFVALWALWIPFWIARLVKREWI